VTVTQLQARRNDIRHLNVLSGQSDHVTVAESDDGVWGFRWDEDERAYYVTHNPTGLLQVFANLDDALSWTLSPNALADLHDLAIRQLRAPFQLDVELARYRRALMWFGGDLLASSVDTDARCHCGGFLARQAGRWVHVDTCVECRATPTEPCPDDRNTHAVCHTPRPVVCDHNHCRAPGDLNALPCERGYDSCSGCCHDGGRP
jgi:hypothetical protein